MNSVSSTRCCKSRNPAEAAEVIRNALLKHLDELEQLSTEQLLEERRRRLANFGRFKDA